jgi:hypothetical protein
VRPQAGGRKRADEDSRAQGGKSAAAGCLNADHGDACRTGEKSYARRQARQSPQGFRARTRTTGVDWVGNSSAQSRGDQMVRRTEIFRGFLAWTLLLALACVPPRSTAPKDGGVRTDAGSGGADACGLTVPVNHRAATMSCDQRRPPSPDGGANGAPGQCDSDESCDGGLNGRCAVSPLSDEAVCSYDQCFSDADCGDAGICACRDPAGYGENACLAANCQTDSDCGPCGYCSPSPGGCAPYIGPVGYYCHTPGDECVNDSDCAARGLPTFYCQFDPIPPVRWVCAPLDCSG